MWLPNSLSSCIELFTEFLVNTLIDGPEHFLMLDVTGTMSSQQVAYIRADCRHTHVSFYMNLLRVWLLSQCESLDKKAKSTSSLAAEKFCKTLQMHGPIWNGISLRNHFS